jgi:integrase
MVQAAVSTECRYSELANLRCADFNTDSDTLTIRQAKSGNPRHVVLTSEGRTLFTAWTAGRPANMHIFVRDDGQPWGRSHQQRPLTDASEIAKISPPVNFHVLRHTHASHLAMKGVGSCCTARPCRHTDDRKALCASSTILCCRHDPRAFPDTRNYGRYRHRHYEAEKAWRPADLKFG